jgi:hypothetical protein
MTQDTAVVIVVAIVMVVGLAGTVLPILPGIWLIWGAALASAVLVGEGGGGWVMMAVITLLAVGGTAAGVYVPQRRAAAIGVPWWGQLTSAVLSVVGLFAIPIVGAPIGFTVGIVASSLAQTRNLRSAWTATLSTLRSMLIASGIQFAAGFAMILAWVIWLVVI